MGPEMLHNRCTRKNPPRPWSTSVKGVACSFAELVLTRPHVRPANRYGGARVGCGTSHSGSATWLVLSTTSCGFLPPTRQPFFATALQSKGLYSTLSTIGTFVVRYASWSSAALACLSPQGRHHMARLSPVATRTCAYLALFFTHLVKPGRHSIDAHDCSTSTSIRVLLGDVDPFPTGHPTPLPHLPVVWTWTASVGLVNETRDFAVCCLN
jgi:hypothetical protein